MKPTESSMLELVKVRRRLSNSLLGIVVTVDKDVSFALETTLAHFLSFGAVFLALRVTSVLCSSRSLYYYLL